MSFFPEKKKTGIFLLSTLSCFFIFSLMACDSSGPVRGLAVNVVFSDRTLTDDLVTNLRVKYITTASFQTLDKDYRIVAVADWQGRILFRENLEPETPTSRWQASRVYEAEKYLYFPKVIDPFNRKLASGIKLNFRILMENAEQAEPLVLFSRTIKLLPSPVEAPDVVFLDGWQIIRRVEQFPQTSLQECWTGRRAVCLLKNPGRTAILMIKGRNFCDSLRVSFILNADLLDEFILEEGEFQKTYSVAPVAVEAYPELRLTIVVDRIVPISRIYPEAVDERQVGLKIEKVYFR